MYTLDEVRKTFDAWAPLYDATHAWTLPKRREARLALGLRPGDRVLDLACGTGLNLPHPSSLVGESGRVVGVDLSSRMLEIARRRIARHGLGNAEVREGDAARLPFPDASFEAVLCTFALNIIPDYRRAIAEGLRVLAPGGRFVSLEMRPGGHSVPGWLRPLAGICSVNMSHHSLDELRRVFPDLHVQTFWMGMYFLAVGTK